MKKLSITLKIILIIFFIHNNYAYSNNQNSIIGKVGDKIISSYELKNKILTTLFFTNEQINQENINKTKTKSLSSLVNYKLKKVEIERLNIFAEDKKVNEYIDNIGKKYNTNKDGLKKMFSNNSIDFDLYYDEIKTELSWQQIIVKLYINKINIEDNRIELELKKFLDNQSNVVEYNLAEIEVAIGNNDNSNDAISEITTEINKIGFNNTAIKFSVSTSAFDGGKIGWINSKSLSVKMLNILKNMKIGEISKPIIQPNTLIFLQLLDKREIKTSNLNLENLRNTIVNRKTNEMLGLFSSSHLTQIKNKIFIEIK